LREAAVTGSIVRMQIVFTPTPTRNTGFVKRVRAFAKPRTPSRRPAALLVCAASAVLLMTLVGAFDTGAMPVLQRLGFWTLLIGLNAILWQTWFGLTVRRPGDWPRSAAIGAVVLNLPLPLEIALVMRLFGFAQGGNIAGEWSAALGISAIIFGAVLALGRRARPTPAEASIQPGGLLARAGAHSTRSLLAIRAEDHYCRVFLSDGRTPLLHHRFGDALVEVAALDGVQVHRGVWVADSGVQRAERAGRAWRLILADGTKLPVSAKCVPEARARGWLARTNADPATYSVPSLRRNASIVPETQDALRPE